MYLSTIQVFKCATNFQAHRLSVTSCQQLQVICYIVLHRWKRSLHQQPFFSPQMDLFLPVELSKAVKFIGQLTILVCGSL